MVSMIGGCVNCPTDAVGGILKNGFEDAAPSYDEGKDSPLKH